MAEAVNQARNEFWRPPVAMPDVTIGHDLSESCDGCGSEFILGSRFCHSCGATRPESQTAQTIQVPGLFELIALGKRFGLTTPALAAFLLGVFCLAGAVAVGIVFTARTALDWQAIQLWRIEWLLGAIAAFGAGCLLKKSS